MDYDVIVRVPVRARDLRDAHEHGADIVAVLDDCEYGDSRVDDVEPTGASGEE